MARVSWRPLSISCCTVDEGGTPESSRILVSSIRRKTDAVMNLVKLYPRPTRPPFASFSKSVYFTFVL